MDSLFNLQIPASSKRRIIVRPKGKVFVNGVAAYYAMDYDQDRLGLYLSESEYKYLMAVINDTVNSYWPCGCSIWTGYVLAPFTLGMSLLIPNICIKDAKQNLIYAVER